MSGAKNKGVKTDDETISWYFTILALISDHQFVFFWHFQCNIECRFTHPLPWLRLQPHPRACTGNSDGTAVTPE